MAIIRYISDGRKHPAVKVSVSMNHGASWQERDLLPGQSFPIPPHATALLMNNVPYDPKTNYDIRQGKVSQTR